MKRDHQAEIAELPETYRRVLTSANEGIANAVRHQGPTVFVGSGGALAAAQFAADLHMKATGELAVATTPLSAATARLTAESGLVLFSARGRHPDSSLVMAAARARGSAHLGLVTASDRDDLPAALAAADVSHGQVATTRDGFLATNSLLAMFTALCVAFEADLPADLPSFHLADPSPLSDLTVVLSGPGTLSIAVDLETRLAETGLSAAQISDYRNVAHGRHVGLMRNRDRMTVVGLTDPQTEPLAQRTLGLLPTELDVRYLSSELNWPASVPDLLVQSIRTVQATGQAQGLDPGRPGVSSFGRRLYHLPIRRLVDDSPPDPIERKFPHDRSAPARATASKAYGHFLDHLKGTSVGGVVLDYDGTCCPTFDRFRPPPDGVRLEIARLLAEGLVVGFASGRGKSLIECTRSWLAEEHWKNVHVGLYNGSVLMRLSDDVPTDIPEHAGLSEAAERVGELGELLLIERRSTQVSVSARDRQATAHLLAQVQAVLGRPPALACKAIASGHSVDIVAINQSKVNVLDAVAGTCSGAVLCIGDQGQVDGNDFELLAATVTTLSVDRCSTDPTRCWNLDRRGDRGPELLTRYFRSLKMRKSGHRFTWSES